MLEHREQVVADLWLVVFTVAGREDRHLAGGTVGRPDVEFARLVVAAALTEAVAVIFRQARLGMYAERRFEQRASVLVAIRGIDDIGDDRNARKAADGIGRRHDLVAQARAPLLVAVGLGTQHQVRKIHVPLVWRYVRTLGQVAQVAEIAVVDDFPVILLVDTVDLHGFGFVDQIEQGRK